MQKLRMPPTTRIVASTALNTREMGNLATGWTGLACLEARSNRGKPEDRNNARGPFSTGPGSGGKEGAHGARTRSARPVPELALRACGPPTDVHHAGVHLHLAEPNGTKVVHPEVHGGPVA